jgi:hypothetical protein
VVTITSPAGNATVSGVVNVSATVTDNLGIEFVRFYAGTTVLGDDGIPPYGWLWNTAGFAPGAIELRVVAKDLVGNVSEDKVTVTINNGPQ